MDYIWLLWDAVSGCADWRIVWSGPPVRVWAIGTQYQARMAQRHFASIPRDDFEMLPDLNSSVNALLSHNFVFSMIEICGGYH
jgi:hypothetical protein